MRFHLLTVSLLILAGLGTACSSSSDADSFAVSFAEQMPRPIDQKFAVQFTNFDRAIEQLDLAGTNSCDVPDESGIFNTGLAAADIDGWIGTPELLITSYLEPELLRTSFGFDICDVHSSAAVATSLYQPTDFALFLDLDTEPQEIEAAIHADAAWVDRLKVEDIDGTTLYDWGDSNDFDRRSRVRKLGVGGQLAVPADREVIVTTARDVMDETLDADRDRLIDAPGVRSILERLDELGTFTVYLSDGAGLVSDLGDPAFMTASRVDPLAPFQLFGYGISIEDGSGVLYLVLDHSGEAGARTNTERLANNLRDGRRLVGDQGWSDAFVIDSVEQHGTTVVAKLISQDDDSLMAAALEAFDGSLVRIDG